MKNSWAEIEEEEEECNIQTKPALTMPHCHVGLEKLTSPCK